MSYRLLDGEVRCKDGTPVTGLIANSSHSYDAFGKIRVSQAYTEFDDKHIYAKNDGVNGQAHWIYDLTGSATATYVSAESEVNLACTTASGDKAIKQSRRYLPYLPGRSQQVLLTGIMGTGETNCTKMIGFGDSLNGVFFIEKDGVYGVRVRTNTSGSAVDTDVMQSDWNVDKFDGNGDSGITIDFTKTQIFCIDFQWLGVGKIRFGFAVDGAVLTAHEIKNENVKTMVYMQSATLPVHYSIENTGTTTGANTLTSICSSVITEGMNGVSGPSFTVSTTSYAAPLVTAITTRKPILLVRLKNTFESKPNRLSCEILGSEFYAEDQSVFFELARVSDPQTVTATFSDVQPNISGCEKSVGSAITTFTVGTGIEHIITTKFVPASSGGAKAFSSAGGSDPHSVRDAFHWITQNYDSSASQYFVVYATSMAGASAAKAAATIEWQEVY